MRHRLHFLRVGVGLLLRGQFGAAWLCVRISYQSRQYVDRLYDTFAEIR